MAALATSGAPAFAQGSSNASTIVVMPAQVPVAGSPESYRRAANLPPPPPGPIVSRLLPIPQGANLSLPGDIAVTAASAPAGGAPPSPATTGAVLPSSELAAAAVPSAGAPLAVIPFSGQSANLTDSTRTELQGVAKLIADKRIAHVELRAFAIGGNLDSRKIALARALVVRSYLVDLKVKARIEVGSFSGDGQHVEILVPGT
ncbi:MAG: OmpA family protein [Pseudomonadota bacterium]